MSNSEERYPNEDGSYPKPGRLDADSPEQPAFSPALDAELQRLAPSRVTVLLVGGGSLHRLAVARALHDRSHRASEPFVVRSVAGLDSDSAERAVFGGPVYAAIEAGAVELARGGTLYVDAIDELPLLIQPRFLRFLDGDRTARIVASAVSDLFERVRCGAFRFDLAERLTLIQVKLPDGSPSV